MATYPDARAAQVFDLCVTYLRRPTSLATDEVSGEPIIVFDPPLSAAEQVIFGDLVTMAKFGVTLTLAEWQSVKADAAGLKAYLGLASPTNAQTVAATKAIIRVLGTIIRS